MFENKKEKILFILGLLIPVLLVFRTYFQSGTLVWGDAPYLFPEGLKELIRFPSVWLNRGANFGRVNSVIFLSPLMVLYGMFGGMGLGNDVIIRVLFYFPSLILSILGPIYLFRYLGLGKVTQFIGAMLFTFNTYYLLLVDGGQVGVALAYGLFPFTLLALKKLSDKPKIENFYISLIFTFLLTIIDPRISIVALITIFIWMVMEKKFSKYFLYLGLALLGLNSFWLVPLIKSGGGGFPSSLSDNPLSILNPLLLFQPHFPMNVFGKVMKPPFYFFGVPVLIFGNILLKKKKKIGVYTILFLFFVFLVKGNAPPFGSWYDFVVDKIPFGVSFRDSSKFFVPLFIFAGILIGQTVELVMVRFKAKKVLSGLVVLSVYVYLLILIFPALSGNLNFVLSGRKHGDDYFKIKNELVKDDSFFRTLWFPERHPLSFWTENNPELDAKSLVSLRPFSMMNVGSYDSFNFMNNEKFVDLFDVLGIKYLVFSGDQRKLKTSEKEQIEWDNLLTLTSLTKGVERVDWGVSIPVFKIDNIKPRIYGMERLIAVVGSDSVILRNNLKLGNVGFVFFEDGVFDPNILEGKSPKSIDIFFNGKEKEDLTLSFLQDYFVSAGGATKNEWATYSPSEYLTWKYQLLTRGISVDGMNYSRSTVFSTSVGEVLEYDLDVVDDGEYVLAIRSLKENDESVLEYELDGKSGSVEVDENGSFGWFVERVELKAGMQRLILKNGVGLSSVNIVSLIPKNKYEESVKKTEEYLDHFGSVDEYELDLISNQSKWSELEHKMVRPTKYSVNSPKDSSWIVFSESFNGGWKMKKGVEDVGSVPVYSSINTFYVEGDWEEVEIYFEGQKHVRTGMYLSVFSIIILAGGFLVFKQNKNE